MTQSPFWHPALPRIQLWRTALGIGAIMVIWIATTFAVLAIAARLSGRSIGALAGAADYGAAVAFFLTFLGFHAGLVLVLALLHRRRYRTLFGPALRLNRRHFVLGFAATASVAALLYALMLVEHLILPEEIAPRVTQARALGPWLLGLLPALALIFLQSFAEEAVFRGYLLQQLRARFSSVLIWGVAPSLGFGLLHYDAGSYGTVNALAYVFNATVMGTLAALITLRTGNLAAAAGLHFGNNAVLTVIGIKGNLEGFSLFTVTMDLSGGYATYSILTQSAAMGIAFVLWWRWIDRHRPIAKSAVPD